MIWILMKSLKFDYLSELHDIKNCRVKLPNGQHTYVIKEGSVVLDGGLNILMFFMCQN